MNHLWTPVLNVLIMAILFTPLTTGPEHYIPQKHISVSTNYSINLPIVLNGFESSFVEKTSTTPDYQQSDPAYGGFPGQGSQYCAPTAASNSLIWLDDHGYDRLVQNSVDRKRDQFDMITLLGSSSYMDTSLENGTGLNDFLNGLKKFVHNRDYQFTRLNYQGWRYHDSEFSTGVEIPELTWVMVGTRELSSSWFNIGKYTYDSASDEYTRHGGHYVTVVGYGYNRDFPTPIYFIVHDPARGDVNGITNLILSLEEITSGTLQGDYSGLPRNAAGYFRLTFHYPVNKDHEDNASFLDETIYILDGAVVLEMPVIPGFFENQMADLFLEENLKVTTKNEGN